MFTMKLQSELHWPAEIFTTQDLFLKINENLHLMKITHFTVLVFIRLPYVLLKLMP